MYTKTSNIPLFALMLVRERYEESNPKNIPLVGPFTLGHLILVNYFHMVCSMIGEDRQLVTDEPVEFDK